jgi:hypothetical protein
MMDPYESGKSKFLRLLSGYKEQLEREAAYLARQMRNDEAVLVWIRLPGHLRSHYRTMEATPAEIAGSWGHGQRFH